MFLKATTLQDTETLRSITTDVFHVAFKRGQNVLPTEIFFDQKHAEILIWYEKDEPIGWTSLFFANDIVWIRYFYVKATHRRQGSGRKMFLALLDLIPNHCSEIKLFTCHTEQSILFWKSMGFSDTIPMVYLLNFL